MPYVQWHKGSYRFRRAVPERFRAQVAGAWEWIEALGPEGKPITDRTEANRLALPHIAKTDADLAALRNGTYTNRTDTDIRVLTRDFVEHEWPRAKREYTRHIHATFLNMDGLRSARSRQGG